MLCGRCRPSVHAKLPSPQRRSEDDDAWLWLGFDITIKDNASSQVAFALPLLDLEGVTIGGSKLLLQTARLAGLEY